MQKFDFYCPTKIIFGAGRKQEIGEQTAKAGARKAMIVFGGHSALNGGLIDFVEGSLHTNGVESVRFGGVQPNPRLSHVYEGVRIAVENHVDFLLAVGGGSSIDTAKAIAIGAANPEIDVWDVWAKDVPFGNILPVGVLLTISAAGSETSQGSVITNDENQMKRGHSDDRMRPVFAVMDPELTYSVPKYQVMCGVVDIMMHTIERYFNPITDNMLTDEISLGLLRTVVSAGKRAYVDQTDYDAMSELMWAGSLSHNGLTGLGGIKDFTCHKFGHELSGMFDKAHGATLSAVWCHWARYCAKTDFARFARFGAEVWRIDNSGLTDEEAAMAAINAVEAFFRSIEMPTNLKELGLGELDEATLQELSMRCTSQATIKVGKFQPLPYEDVLAIFRLSNQ